MLDLESLNPVSTIATADLITVPGNLPLELMRAMFRVGKLSRVVVVDDAARPVGVVSLSDLVAREGLSDQMPVNALMSHDVVSVPAEATIVEACQVMAEKNLHGLAVLGPTGDRWLSATDVVRWVATRANP